MATVTIVPSSRVIPEPMTVAATNHRPTADLTVSPSASPRWSRSDTPHRTELTAAIGLPYHILRPDSVRPALRGRGKRALKLRTGDLAIAGKRILVIKHGALGDIVLATGPFRAIREAHARDHLTLLTSTPYVGFLCRADWFDEIMIDDRTPAWHFATWFNLIRRLRERRFHRVYDLQRSNRTNLLYRALSWSREIEWSGIASGCSHPHSNPRCDAMHTIERQAEQLAAAGIASTPPTDLSWVRADVGRLEVHAPYALVIPGGAPHRPAKRWPTAKYAELANLLAAEGTTPILIGSAAEAAVLRDIASQVPQARNLCGRTDLFDIVALARDAAVAIGNDTGPMHVAAAVDCPAVVLFSSESDPALTAPRGACVELLRMTSLADLAVDKVVAASRRILAACATARQRSDDVQSR